MKHIRINAYRFAGFGLGVNGSSWSKLGTGIIKVRGDGFVEYGSDDASLHHAIYKDKSGIKMEFHQNLYGHSEYYVKNESLLVR